MAVGQTQVITSDPGDENDYTVRLQQETTERLVEVSEDIKLNGFLARIEDEVYWASAGDPWVALARLDIAKEQVKTWVWQEEEARRRWTSKIN